MAEIKPFKGLRYTEKAGEISQLACPPYDIINGEERQALLDKNPYNLIRLELPVIGGSEDIEQYRSAGDTLRTWLSEEILKRDDKASVYIYDMDF